MMLMRKLKILKTIWDIINMLFHYFERENMFFSPNFNFFFVEYNYLIVKIEEC